MGRVTRGAAEEPPQLFKKASSMCLAPAGLPPSNPLPIGTSSISSRDGISPGPGGVCARALALVGTFWNLHHCHALRTRSPNSDSGVPG